MRAPDAIVLLFILLGVAAFCFAAAAALNVHDCGYAGRRLPRERDRAGAELPPAPVPRPVPDGPGATRHRGDGPDAS